MWGLLRQQWKILKDHIWQSEGYEKPMKRITKISAHISSFDYNGDVLARFHYFYGTIVVAPKAREGEGVRKDPIRCDR